MPTYTFTCTGCNKDSEKILKMSELDTYKLNASCEACKAPLRQTILTAPPLNIPWHMRTAFQWEGAAKGREAGKYHGVNIHTGESI